MIVNQRLSQKAKLLTAKRKRHTVSTSWRHLRHGMAGKGESLRCDDNLLSVSDHSLSHRFCCVGHNLTDCKNKRWFRQGQHFARPTSLSPPQILQNMAKDICRSTFWLSQKKMELFILLIYINIANF